VDDAESKVDVEVLLHPYVSECQLRLLSYLEHTTGKKVVPLAAVTATQLYVHCASPAVGEDSQQYVYFKPIGGTSARLHSSQRLGRRRGTLTSMQDSVLIVAISRRSWTTVIYAAKDDVVGRHTGHWSFTERCVCFCAVGILSRHCTSQNHEKECLHYEQHVRDLCPMLRFAAGNEMHGLRYLRVESPHQGSFGS
jgi:hypothetical protein